MTRRLMPLRIPKKTQRKNPCNPCLKTAEGRLYDAPSYYLLNFESEPVKLIVKFNVQTVHGLLVLIHLQ